MVQISRWCTISRKKQGGSAVHLRLVIRAHARQVMGIGVKIVRRRGVVGGIFILLEDRGQVRDTWQMREATHVVVGRGRG